MNDNKILSTSSPSSDGSSLVDLIIDPAKKRFPFCIVWTPIPFLTYLLPFIGHIGIATSAGIIRDFAGPYYVSEDDMAFGQPKKYWQLKYTNARGGVQGWDAGIAEASDIYKTRMHILCYDNCHSHVATSLNLMHYNNSRSWNMVKIALLMLVHGKYVSYRAIVETWLPFIILVAIILSFCLLI